MYVVGDWVKGNIDNLSFGDCTIFTFSQSHHCSFLIIFFSWDLPHPNLCQIFTNPIMLLFSDVFFYCCFMFLLLFHALCCFKFFILSFIFYVLCFKVYVVVAVFLCVMFYVLRFMFYVLCCFCCCISSHQSVRCILTMRWWCYNLRQGPLWS